MAPVEHWHRGLGNPGGSRSCIRSRSALLSCTCGAAGASGASARRGSSDRGDFVDSAVLPRVGNPDALPASRPSRSSADRGRSYCTATLGCGSARTKIGGHPVRPDARSSGKLPEVIVRRLRCARAGRIRPRMQHWRRTRFTHGVGHGAESKLSGNRGRRRAHLSGRYSSCTVANAGFAPRRLGSDPAGSPKPAQRAPCRRRQDGRPAGRPSWRHHAPLTFIEELPLAALPNTKPPPHHRINAVPNRRSQQAVRDVRPERAVSGVDPKA